MCKTSEKLANPLLAPAAQNYHYFFFNIILIAESIELVMT